MIKNNAHKFGALKWVVGELRYQMQASRIKERDNLNPNLSESLIR
jgi:hypothetical protein